MTDFNEKRDPNSRGRRKYPYHDGYECQMKEEWAVVKSVMRNLEECIRILKDGTKNEIRRVDHKFEVLEGKLNNYVTKWTLVIIIGIATTAAGTLMWQLNGVNKMLLALTSTTTEIATKQRGVLHELEKLAPEHHELMLHLEKTEREKNNVHLE